MAQALPSVPKPQQLAFEEIGTDGSKTMMVFHGITGSGRHWRSIAKRVCELSGWKVVLVDLRNHGLSAELGFPPPHNLRSTAEDVAKLVRNRHNLRPDVLVGHSMGGKVALEFINSCVDEELVAMPERVWLLDTRIGLRPPGFVNDTRSDLERFIDIACCLPRPFPSRKWLQDALVQGGVSPGFANSMSSSAKKRIPSSEQVDWAFDPQGVRDMFHACEVDHWHILECPPDNTTLEVVRASKSGVWSPDDVRRLQKLAHKHDQVKGRVMDATHWLHVDDPMRLAKLLASKC